MTAYIVRRLLYMIPILLGVAALVFALFTAVGEDPVRVALGPHATPESIADLRHAWGLDRPLWLQFGDFLGQIIRADFGHSYQTGEKLSDMFWQGAWVSFSLTAPPFILGTCLNILIALGLAAFRGSLWDRLGTAVCIMSMSVSYLVYIIALQYFLGYRLGWFPVGGFAQGLAGVPYLVLPGIILIAVAMGPDVRMFRTVFLDEIDADYVRTARAKGLPESKVLLRHVLKNAAIPILTHTMVSIPFLVLGAFLMERYFSIPGIGDLLIQAINTGDFPVLKGMTMLIAIGFSTIQLLTDILYAAVDPRVELS